MARKTLSDFNYDYQKYADYLESAECANDDGYDMLVDVPSGNIYERTNGDWTKGHGHKNVYNGYERDKDDDRSKGRLWKNHWLKYLKKLNLTENEVNFINENKNGKKLTLSKRK